MKRAPRSMLREACCVKHGSRSMDQKMLYFLIIYIAAPVMEQEWTSLTVARSRVDRPTLIYFYSDECPPCKKLVKLHEEEKEVIKTLKDFDCVQVKVPSDNSIIWGVKCTPTHVWVNRKWRIVGRVSTIPLEKRPLIKYLKKWRKKL